MLTQIIPVRCVRVHNRKPIKKEEMRKLIFQLATLFSLKSSLKRIPHDLTYLCASLRYILTARSQNCVTKIYLTKQNDLKRNFFATEQKKHGFSLTLTNLLHFPFLQWMTWRWIKFNLFLITIRCRSKNFTKSRIWVRDKMRLESSNS